MVVHLARKWLIRGTFRAATVRERSRDCQPINDRELMQPSTSPAPATGRYNSYVSRLLAFVLVAGLGFAQGQLRERQETPPEAPLIDEDEDLLPRTQYAFNPIQAQKDLKIGNFYARKGNHRAAAGRYLEATKWNPSYAEAYWRLGRSREKLKQPSDALAAYRRFLQLAPDDKRAKAVRRKIPALDRQVETEPPAQQKR